MNDPRSVHCPKCGAAAGQPCIGGQGQARISSHRERWNLMKPVVARIPKKHHRFGAFLRLYGPASARTHAMLIMGHAPRPHTPEAFLDELEEEKEANKRARSCGGAVTVVLKPTLDYGY